MSAEDDRRILLNLAAHIDKHGSRAFPDEAAELRAVELLEAIAARFDLQWKLSFDELGHAVWAKEPR